MQLSLAKRNSIHCSRITRALLELPIHTHRLRNYLSLGGVAYRAAAKFPLLSGEHGDDLGLVGPDLVRLLAVLVEHRLAAHQSVAVVQVDRRLPVVSLHPLQKHE